MKKVFSNTSPSKLVRRVLSRTSNISRRSEEDENKQAISDENMGYYNRAANLEQEIAMLKEQVSILQITVKSMQCETEKKEKALATLAREKEKLALDLKREKRSCTSLKQQLDDERTYYYKEKEQYCQEMNSCKQLKKKIKENIESTDIFKKESEEIIKRENENSKLKEALNQTLEANYNLSIKFLRMKNTKCNLKSRLQALENEHKKAMTELSSKVENLKNELLNIEDKIKSPLTPSSKRYLQIVKQNGTLMHENLCFQIEMDRLTLELEHHKARKLRSETNDRLQLLNKKSKKELTSDKKEEEVIIKSEKQSSKVKKKVKRTDLTKSQTENTASEQKTKTEKKSSKIMEGEVKKIFERHKQKGIPEITMLPTSDEGRINKPSTALPRATDSEVFLSFSTDCPSQIRSDVSECPSQNRTDVSNYPSQVRTEVSGYSQYVPSCIAIRTQSAPEIVQTAVFVKNNKVKCSNSSKNKSKSY